MLPLLYTFRRCPYAIRARLAIKVSGIEVETREVDLRNKPQALLDCSPKGTVPVIQLPNGQVIEESLDIMQWALSINDPEEWMSGNNSLSAEVQSLVNQNDGSFKHFLDRYKYADRFPEHPVSFYREQAETFILELDTLLSKHNFLFGNQRCIADMAILPFVRQFAKIDNDWFCASNYDHVIKWLDDLLASTLFGIVIQK